MARKLKERVIAPLNEEQLTAVLTTEGPLRVAACAGSGKSTMLVERFAFLVEEKKVPPERILLVAFSADAKAVVERRLKRRMPGVDVSASVRTAHSIGLEVFKAENSDTRWNIDPTEEMYKKIVRQVVDQHGMPYAFSPMLDFIAVVKREVLGYHAIPRALGVQDPRMMMLASHHFPDAEVGVSLFYEIESLREKGVLIDGHMVRPLTFDDMLYHSAIALSEASVRERWGRRYSYVMGDEHQDENAVQRALIEAMAGHSGNYCVVGDPAQAIFSFRGARTEGLMQFEDRWPGATTIKLTGNYRSGNEIIHVANNVLGAMPSDTVIDMRMVSKRGTPARVTGVTYESPAEEAREIAGEIASLYVEDTNEWREFAILVRANYMLDPLRDALELAKVPFRVEGRESVPKGSRNTVALSTCHRFKGNERKHVYLVQASSWRGDEVDERRVFYVAVTRARDHLTVSYSVTDEYGRHMSPSSFVREAGIDMGGNLV